MEEELVSIIIVCYNGEKFIKRSIQSILNQTYNKIEIVFVNDGSKDRTEKVLESLRVDIQKRGYELQYLSKKNEGQAAALNDGLKLFKGKYLAFLDVDDELEKTSIEKRVKYLQENKEYGLVRTKGKIVDDETNEVIGHIQHQSDKIKTDIFDDLIMERDIWVSNGCYMIRYDAFIDSIPTRDIYVHRGGQNWQVLLPITHKYKCGYIDEELFIYHVIKESHSHKGGTFEIEYNRCIGHEEILTEVLKSLNEYNKYEKKLTDKYARKKMLVAREYKRKKELKEEFKKLKQNKTCTLKDKIIFFLGMVGL